jgi:hypothetical protein
MLDFSHSIQKKMKRGYPRGWTSPIVYRRRRSEDTQRLDFSNSIQKKMKRGYSEAGLLP